MKRVVGRELLTTILREAAPADLRIVGRMLLHAAIVGVAAGLMGAAFFAALELVQRLVLEDLGGYRPLRAHGETFLPEIGEPGPLPSLAAGAAARRSARSASGIISELAPETRGGGGDAMIDAFHHQGGVIRKRVVVGEGARVDLHAGDGRLGRPRGADDADRRRARLDRAARLLGVDAARAPHPDGRGRRRPASRPCSARRSARRCWPSRCSTATTSSPTRSSRRSSPASSPTRSSSRSSASRRCSRTPGAIPFVIKHLPLYALLALLVVGAGGGVPVDAAHASSA